MNELKEIQTLKPLRFKCAEPGYKCITYFCSFNLFTKYLPKDLPSSGIYLNLEVHGDIEVKKAETDLICCGSGSNGKKVYTWSWIKKTKPEKIWVTWLTHFPLFECQLLKNNNLIHFLIPIL